MTALRQWQFKMVTAAMFAVIGLAGGASAQGNWSVLDDFEGGSNQNLFGDYWYFFDDNNEQSSLTGIADKPDGSGKGSSKVFSAYEKITGSNRELLFTPNLSIADDGANGSSKAAKLEFEWGNAFLTAYDFTSPDRAREPVFPGDDIYNTGTGGINLSGYPDCVNYLCGPDYFAPFVGIGTNLVPDGETNAPVGFENATEMNFWAKAADLPLSVWVFFEQSDIGWYDNWNKRKKDVFYGMWVDIRPEWTRYTIPLQASPCDANVGILDYITSCQPDGLLRQPNMAAEQGFIKDFDKSKIVKIGFQIQAANYVTSRTGNNNPNVENGSAGVTGYSNTLYLDDISFTGFRFVFGDMCESCVGPVGSVSADAVRFDKFAESSAQNTLGYYWYFYDDTKIETDNNVGGTSLIGNYDEKDCNSPNIDIDAGECEAIVQRGMFYNYLSGEFELGNNIVIDAEVVNPFVGIGTNLYDYNAAPPVFYDADAASVTGLYFEYRTDEAEISKITFEVHDQYDATGQRPAAAAYYINLPATGGEWRSATVPFSKLVQHTRWEIVKNWNDANPDKKALNTSQLAKFRFEIKDGSGKTGILQLREVYTIGGAVAPTTTWDCGKVQGEVTATLDPATGILTIVGSGSGEMKDFDLSSANLPPWDSHKNDITDVVIGDGVKSIGAFAFYIYSSNLKSVTISNSVISIGERAFYRSSGIESVTIGDGVETIGDAAFYGCTGLASVTLGDGVTSIGSNAFVECRSLTSLTIPSNVNFIGSKAFWSCSNLKTIVSLCEIPPFLENDVFYGIAADACLTVPSGSEVAYRDFNGGNGWGGFSCFEEITAPTTWTVIFKDWNGTVLKTEPDVEHGSSATAPSNPDNRPGWHFVGWDKTFNNVTGDLVVTAVYEEDLPTVTLVKVSPASTVNVQKGKTRTFTATVEGTNNPSQAVAWSVSGNKVAGTTISTAGLLKVAAGETAATLTVKATSTLDPAKSGTATVNVTEPVVEPDEPEPEIYKITFDANGGAVSPASGKTKTSGKVSLPTPEREGYTFEGWYTAKTGGKNVTVNTVFEDNITIYAQWTVKNYKVTFSAGANGAISATVGGKDIETGAEVEYGKSVVFTAEPDEGYKVNGWKLGSKTVSGNKTETYTIDKVTDAVAVTVSFAKTDAVLTPDRVIPNVRPEEEATVIAPVVIWAGEFTAGPNPVNRQAGSVGFFRQGKRIANGELRIYDAVGNVVGKVKIVDKALGSQARRQIGSWDLTDSKGRPVNEGTYLVKGVLKTSDGKKEKVSVILGVR